MDDQSEPTGSDKLHTEDTQGEVIFSALDETILIEELRCSVTDEVTGWMFNDTSNGNTAPIHPEAIPELIAMYKAFYEYAVESDDVETPPLEQSDAVALTDGGVLEIDLYPDEAEDED